MSVRLGEILISEGALTFEQLDTALRYQREQGGRLGSILIQLGYVSDEIIATALSKQYGVPLVKLAKLQIAPEVVRLIPIETAIRYQLLPVRKVGTTLTVATTDPTNVLVLDEIKFITGYSVEPVVAPEGAIRDAIERYYGTEQTLEIQRVYDQLAAAGEYELEISAQSEDLDLGALQKTSSEAPIIKLVNIILGEAIRRGASDIHLEPYEREYRVRYRIDGVLYNVMNPPPRFRDAMISRIKIMSNLDISERRLPQDGRIKVRINYDGRRKEIDFRVSSLPVLFGEKIVLRILDREKLPLDLTQLGFEPESLVKFEKAIHRPYGMVLVTGPTGSGKTSTLYTSLNKLNTPEVNIMTAEDPVEFNFPGINQVQTKEQVGLTFAAALRSFLRQDPNIILVGEIRDLETAEIAVKAALTGHLVLSTVHTNDAPSTISRLLNMGVEPFLVATSVHLICAQRLVRKICTDCKERVETPVKALIDIGFPAAVAKNVVTYRGTGCKKCNDSRYRGRIGLYEVMEVTPSIQNMILTGATASQIREKAKEDGMITLRESGLEKIRAGLTTIDEVLRETMMEGN
ncbi:MAG: type IV-A pilus assembly ATPase PilB [Acidobacteria bacterium]|nr:type IV-A pilus assembly ATPase PilB [Acidobacteriota bacterium]